MNVRLVTYRPTLTASGIYINNGSGYAVSASAISIAVDGASATTVLDNNYVNAGRATLVDSQGTVYGVIKSVDSATQITLFSLDVALSDDDQLYYYPENAYELELQEAPNISINFQFSDIKEPETRKGSYTQTFKLPFTDANNKFFQNWYNVNLSTLVFTTKRKFSAVLFVGTVPQFEGYIQLKAIYKKAEYYEVILMSNTADLFSVIGEKKLKDVFKDENGNYSNELNHNFTKTNIQNSWNGTSSSFTNTSGISLRDTDFDVQKVMYPLSVTESDFFFEEGSKKYLDMSDADIAEYIPAGANAWQTQNGYASAAQFMVRMTQLRPAIQIRTLFKFILARAGFSYTSDFIDGTGDFAADKYFGKIYMTTGNKLPTSYLPTAITLGTAPGGYVEAKDTSAQDGFNYTFNATAACGSAEPPEDEPFFICGTDVDDNSNVWDEDNNSLKKISETMNWAQLQSIAIARNAKVSGTNSSSIPIQLKTVSSLNTNIVYSITTFYIDSTFAGESTPWIAYADLTNVPPGASVKFKFVAPAMCKLSDAGGSDPFVGLQGLSGLVNPTSRIKSDWLPYNNTQIGKEVLIPQCIDPELTQKAFLKDIIERFNLVLIADPDNASNILIETYDFYLSRGLIVDWTKKQDLLKEIVIKDTTTLQKSIINLSDLEDVDVMNKSIKEEAPSLNVYGKYYNNNINNDFATGELKNNPIFSPFINQKVFKNADINAGTELTNVAVQYEISYDQTDDGIEPALEETNPKLFYYHGETTTIKKNATTKTIYLHEVNPDTSVITANSFTSYPVCTPYDIDTNEAAETYQYELTPNNKSLLWNFAPPQCGDLDIFQWTTAGDSWQKNSLYFRYWRNFLESIYSGDARIMECYFNLNEVDIFNFRFSDEIFVKDCYWRILQIQNYQVGEKASTKVVLLKVVNSVPDIGDAYVNCDYVISGQSDGYYTFCPADNPGCTPDLTSGGNFIGYGTTEECCYSFGGFPDASLIMVSSPLVPCAVNAGSPPSRYSQLDLPISLTGQKGLKSVLQGKISKLNLPLSAGRNRGKYTEPILPRFGDDIMIKYKTLLPNKPQVDGESHKMVLIGNTDGNTRGYAYPENDPESAKFNLPNNSNVIISVKGIATVIGGTSTNYVLGVIEGFSYNTIFRVIGGVVTQIGTAGGVLEWSIKDTSLSTTATLYIAQNSTTGNIEFGLDDSQTDTKRSWTLIVDFTVQNIDNLSLPFDTNWALYQNGDAIRLMNYDYLIWN